MCARLRRKEKNALKFTFLFLLLHVDSTLSYKVNPPKAWVMESHPTSKGNAQHPSSRQQQRMYPRPIASSPHAPSLAECGPGVGRS